MTPSWIASKTSVVFVAWLVGSSSNELEKLSRLFTNFFFRQVQPWVGTWQSGGNTLYGPVRTGQKNPIVSGGAQTHSRWLVSARPASSLTALTLGLLIYFYKLLICKCCLEKNDFTPFKRYPNKRNSNNKGLKTTTIHLPLLLSQKKRGLWVNWVPPIPLTCDTAMLSKISKNFLFVTKLTKSTIVALNLNLTATCWSAGS